MISDPLWYEYFVLAEHIESECYGTHDMFLTALDRPLGGFIYPFRMFFFLTADDYPFCGDIVLALNLELGEFGTCSLGAHDSEKHYNYGPTNPNMSIDEFKVWALETVKKHLDLSNKKL